MKTNVKVAIQAGCILDEKLKSLNSFVQSILLLKNCVKIAKKVSCKSDKLFVILTLSGLRLKKSVR